MSIGHSVTTQATPIGHQANLNSPRHSVQFYEADAFLLNDLSRFVGSALGAGDIGIVIATKAHRDELARQLKARGLDVALATKQGRYVSLDASETLSKFMVDGRPDAERFTNLIGGVISRATAASKNERPRIAAFGEMVALLWAEDKYEAAIQLEQLWNDLAQTFSFDLLCAYPMTSFRQVGDSDRIEEICATHSHVIPVESYTSLINEDERLRAIAILQQKAQALVTEIEERKKVQETLERRNEELKTAIASRDEFISVAAHELKTPLTSLRGFSQLLLRDIRRKRKSPTERIEFALDAIEGQTRKLDQLLVRLLDSAQIEAGKLRIEPVKTDLVALVRSVLTQLLTHSHHTFVFDGPEHLEAEVDPVRFEQIVNNLLDNAIKFSPLGGIVRVGLVEVDPELAKDRSIWLSVTDEGVGIPSDQREHIFERFQQAHGENHLSGMGLGLYITREIVELHGGSIWIEEPEHTGSRFVVTLPPRAISRENLQSGF